MYNKAIIILGLSTILFSACTKDRSDNPNCEDFTVEETSRLDSSSYSFISYALTDTIVFKNNNGDSLVFTPRSFYTDTNARATNIDVPCEEGGAAVDVTMFIDTYTLSFQNTDFILEFRLATDIAFGYPRTTAAYKGTNLPFYDRFNVNISRKNAQGYTDPNNYSGISIIASDKGNTEINNLVSDTTTPLASVTINNQTYNNVYPTGYDKGSLNNLYYTKALGVISFTETPGDTWHFAYKK